MFLEVSQKLPKGLFKACVVPRPIAWISSFSKHGVHNLAPFSYFNIVCDEPPMIMFSTTGSHINSGSKDTLSNVEESGEFTVNLVAFSSREAMNISSMDFSREIDEFDAADIAHVPGQLVKSRRVKESPISLECVYHQSVQLPVPGGTDLINRMVIAKVVGVHVNPRMLTDNRIDINKLNLIARLGYNSFAKITEDFAMKRPEHFGLFKKVNQSQKNDDDVCLLAKL